MTKAERAAIEATRDMLNQYRRAFLDAAIGGQASRAALLDCAASCALDFEEESGRLSRLLNANDPNAVASARAYLENEETVIPIHCSCECPMWGKDRPLGTAAVVECACGRRETACVECLHARRVTSCMVCARELSLPDMRETP